jgi:TRAP-type C4-dicarboxylate transport system permease small subunit
MLNGFLKFVALIERIATAIAAACMFAIMIVVFSDVVMRYMFNRPFSWAYDLISLYLMAGVFFLVLSHAYAAQAHVSVDILQQNLPKPLVRVTEIVTCIVGMIVFAVIAWLGFWRAYESFINNDVVAGAIPWPMWPAIALVPFGAGLLTLRLSAHLIGHIGSLLTGQSLIALPTAHASTEGESFE